jgi:hypothetical protein
MGNSGACGIYSNYYAWRVNRLYASSTTLYNSICFLYLSVLSGWWDGITADRWLVARGARICLKVRARFCLYLLKANNLGWSGNFISIIANFMPANSHIHGKKGFAVGPQVNYLPHLRHLFRTLSFSATSNSSLFCKQLIAGSEIMTIVPYCRLAYYCAV